MDKNYIHVKQLGWWVVKLHPAPTWNGLLAVSVVPIIGTLVQQPSIPHDLLYHTSMNSLALATPPTQPRMQASVRAIIVTSVSVLLWQQKYVTHTHTNTNTNTNTNTPPPPHLPPPPPTHTHTQNTHTHKHTYIYKNSHERMLRVPRNLNAWRHNRPQIIIGRLIIGERTWLLYLWSDWTITTHVTLIHYLWQTTTWFPWYLIAPSTNLDILNTIMEPHTAVLFYW